MAAARDPAPVQLFVAVLANPAVQPAGIRAALERELGAVDLAAGPWPHTFTDYYRDQMGANLLRSFFAFEKLFDPADLADVKLRTNDMEKAFTAGGVGAVARPVNLDPGYVNEGKVVLASMKDFSHRVYLRRGVFGEVTLYYEGGQWRDRPWTFPDYRTEPYKEFFQRVRDRLCGRRRNPGTR